MKKNSMILLIGLSAGILLGYGGSTLLHSEKAPVAAAAEPTISSTDFVAPMATTYATELSVSKETDAVERATESTALPTGMTADTTAVKSETAFATTGESVSPVREEYERTVYITPTGKKYHYSASCAGKNAIPTPLSEAQQKKDACKKCVK